ILKEHIDIALDVLKEMLTSPLFDAKELAKEKEVIKREMDLARDDPSRRISRLTFSSAYTRHPYRVPIIGYKENFERLDREDIAGFFKTNYAPEKTVMAVVGDIDKETVFKDIEGLFGDIPRGDNQFTVVPMEPEHIAENYREEKLDIEGAYLNIVFHSTGVLDRDLYALDILSYIMGQGESSILNQNIRIKKQLVLSISSYNYTPKYPGLFVISSVLKEENVKEAIDEILNEIELIKEKGLSEDGLARAKNNFLAGHIYRKETVESQANDMAIGELLTGNADFFELYIERLKSINLHDIQKAAEKYLRRDNMSVCLLSKSGNVLELYSEETAQREAKQIKKVTLKNDLAVLVSENPSLPIVSMCLLFKGGVRLETEEQNGISMLASLMFMDGTDSMTREEIALFFESKGMQVEAYSGNNSLGIRVSCLSEHTEDAFRLLSDLCVNSVFPEAELTREKDELYSVIDMQDNEIFNHGHRRLKELLFKAHPYRFQKTGTHKSLANIKRQDLERFHKEILSVDNMVLGISGDCKSDEIRILGEKYFSVLPFRKPAFPLPAKEPAIDKIRDILINTDKEQSLVLFGFHGIDIYSKDRYAVEVMLDMLSRESGILFKNIREKEGFAYATGAFEFVGLDTGYIVIYALTSKENIDSVKEIISKQIKLFKEKGPSSEELEISKNHLMAAQRIANETNAHFIFTTSMDELYGLGYNNYTDYDSKINSITRQDIKRVAGDYLTLDKCAILISEGK
ncbi:MAG: insulinase family protein, partial [Candidatus Omnitrophica bacterium]|nr:insulinase family protein [Candidatus Omnitrophota bacterium]